VGQSIFDRKFSIQGPKDIHHEAEWLNDKFNPLDEEMKAALF